MARNRIAASVMAIAVLFGSAALAQEFSGAFYVGDANGNGVIEPADISRAQQKYATGNADYSQVKPPFFDVAELNGNGFVDPPDFQILQYWYINQFPARTGLPATITAVGATTGCLLPGESVVVCVEVDDSPLSGDMIATDRSGWGVNFAIDQTPGLCATATIFGRNPWPAVKNDVGYFNPKAYEYTDRMAPNGNGRACVRVVAPSGCDALNIKVRSYIPSDTEALCNGLPAPCFGTHGRMAVQLDGPTFTFFTGCGGMLTVDPDPAALNDGQTVQLTATSSLSGDVTELSTWSVLSGNCSVSDTAGTKGEVTQTEGCADDPAPCVVQAVYNALSDSATVNVVDNEAGTWNGLRNMACGPVNDGTSMLSACSGCRRYSAADNCDRGDCACVMSCAAGCIGTNLTELCMPTTSGAYNGCCQDGAQMICDGGTVINDEQVPISGSITPNGPMSVCIGQTINFFCLASYADACTENCTSVIDDTASCGNNLTPPSGIYTGIAPFSCGDFVSGTWRTYPIPGETITNIGCSTPPNIVTVFPLQGQPGIPQRNWGNAHTDQVLTAVMQAAGGGVGNADSVTAQCTGPSTVNFTCNLAGYPADLDIPCTPTSAFNGSGTYSCTVTATASIYNDVVTANMYIGMTSAPTDGGHAGGYVGGNLWDSTTNTCNAGPVTICGVNLQTNAAILEKIYVQVRQAGEPVVQRFTSAGTGCVTVTLPCKAIDELHMSFKCGQASCPKLEDGASLNQYKNNLARNYGYFTETGLDAKDLVERMPLMSDGAFYRWKQRIQGTIGENYFTNYIAPRVTGADNAVRLRQIFNPPAKLRAAFIMTTLAGMKEAGGAMDLLFLSADYQVSISLCVLRRNNVDVSLAAALPPNLLVPELLRTNWSGGCSNYSANPGRYNWEYWSYGPSIRKQVMTIGVYANATNFSIAGGLDMFAFPMSVCGVGFYGVTNMANLTGDPIQNIGANAGFRYDLREDWPGALGYDPDSTVDRKVLFSIRGKALPIDPARQNAMLRPVSTYRVPNYTDSELIADATWDDRFLRRNAGVISGADFGLAGGLGITGLSLSSQIDDQQFTTFMVGYLQSTSPKIGARDVRYWSSSPGDTEVASTQHAGIASNWADPTGTNIDFNPLETGGPTNYAGITILMRPTALDGNSAEYNMTSAAAGANPGSILGVWHLGPLEGAGNETVPAADFLNLPLAQAPGPDEYIYPGAQWANPATLTGPINRNGELLRYVTAGPGDGVPAAGGRYYFQFTRPIFQYATGRAVHQWMTQLSEPGYYVGTDPGRRAVSKISLKGRISSASGYATGVNEFNDDGMRYISWGVAAGDSLWVNSRRNDCLATKVLITAVPYQTQVLVTPDWGVGANCTVTGDTNVRYRIFRANKRGECRIDEGYGGGPPGYTCKTNTFWQATGPANTSSIRVYAPTVTPGAATLAGATGYIPSFWDGITANDILSWSYSILVFNTGVTTTGGLGGPFDWNNWETRKDELSLQHGALDAAMVIRQ